MMDRFTKFTLIAMAASSLAFGSQTLIVPGTSSATEGAQSTIAAFRGTPTTFQWQLAASQLTPMLGSEITAIGFRLDGGQQAVAAGTVVSQWDLQLSGAANLLGSLSSTFADNIGAGATTVRSGSLTLPAMPGGVGPNQMFFIPFTTNFTYTGGDLVMTLRSDSANVVPVDARSLVDSLGNTVGNFTSSTATSGLASFLAYPVTGFQYSATNEIPEPGSISLVLIGGAGAAVAAWRRRKSLKQ